METVVGLFREYEDADRLVHALGEIGYTSEDISVVGRRYILQKHVDEDYNPVSEAAADGALGGGIVGGLVGLLAGLSALVIPGIGPVLTAGALATALGTTAAGAGLGAASGGLLGALVGLGVPEEDVHFYAEGIKRGGILVIVRTDAARAPEVRRLMLDMNAEKMEDQRQVWQRSGWRSFDESTMPDEEYPTF